MKLFGHAFDARAALVAAVVELRRGAAWAQQVAVDLSRSRSLLIGIILVGGYWLAVPHIPTEPQNDTLRVARLSVAIGVAIGFGLSLLRVLRTPWPGMTGTIVLGIFLSWFGTAGSAFWVLIWALAGRPDWMILSNINGFFIYINLIGGMLHLTAYNAIDGQIPPKGWVKIGAAVGLIFGLSVWVALSSPDATAIAAWLKPMFADFPNAPD